MTDLPALRPPAALGRIAGRLEEAGFEAWAVGGAIRDVLVGRPGVDWDLATDAHPDEVRRLFRRTVPLGVDHGTLGVMGDDEVLYEVTTFRLDVETDGRHAVVEFADSVDDDLARRDFTINAIAWRPATGEVRDPHGGIADLEDRVLRAVGDPGLRFAEDYLRVLRGLRFAGEYGLTIEPETQSALEGAIAGLDHLSAERVREELLKVLAGARPSVALRLYRAHGVLQPWYPEIAAAPDDAWEAALSTIDAIRPHRLFLRVVRLLLCVDENAGPVESGAGIVLRRLRFSNADIRLGSHLTDHYTPFVGPLDAAASLREWLHEVGVEHARDLFRLHVAAARAAGSEDERRALAYTWRRVHEEMLAGAAVSTSQLAVDGQDLLDLGLPRGPLIGLMLDELLAQVIESPERNERSTLLDAARELIELGGLDRLGEGNHAPEAGDPG